MAAPTSDVARYQRYQQVLEALLREREFSLSEICEACAAERPAFVTRVVRQLHQDGHLEFQSAHLLLHVRVVGLGKSGESWSDR